MRQPSLCCISWLSHRCWPYWPTEPRKWLDLNICGTSDEGGGLRELIVRVCAVPWKLAVGGVNHLINAVYSYQLIGGFMCIVSHVINSFWFLQLDDKVSKNRLVMLIRR